MLKYFNDISEGESFTFISESIDLLLKPLMLQLRRRYLIKQKFVDMKFLLNIIIKGDKPC